MMRLRWVGIGLVVSLAAAACASGGDGAGGEGGSPEGTPDADGVLRYGLEMDVNLSDTFDPAASGSVCDSIVLDFVYDTLIERDAEGNLVPGLAEDWEITPETMTITLRQGLVFHDGTPLDAEAAKRGLEHLRDGNQTRDALQVIDSIDVVGDRTLRLNLSEPDRTLPSALTRREGMIVAPAAIEDESAGTDPVGAGPFRFESFEPGQRIALRPYAEYHDADAYGLGGIDFVQVGVGPPAVTALRSGELDLVNFEAESLAQLENLGGVTIDSQPSEMYLQFQFRTSRPNPDDRDNPTPTVFADPVVRQAVNHAIDRERINEIVLGGQGEVAWMPFPEGTPGHDPDLVGAYPHDPERARQLLADAGLPEGFEFEMVIPGGGITSQERQAELIQDDLAEVGITANITRSTNIATEYYVQKVGEAFAAARPAAADPVSQVTAQWGEFQFVAIHNGAEHSELTALMNSARATFDDAEFAGVLEEAAGIIVDEALEVAIAFQPRNIAWKTDRVSGDLRAPTDACTPVDLRGAFVKA